MKKWKAVVCLGAFLLLAVGTCVFLALFSGTQGAIPIIDWEEASIVDSKGGKTPFDAASGQPALGEGEHFHLSLTLPQRDGHTYLIFEVENLDLTLSLDGRELYRSTALIDENALNGSQIQIPLAAGSGELLEMDVVPLGQVALFPPLLRLAEDPNDTAGTMAYANSYGIPAGAVALAAVLLCGMFLWSVYLGRPAWKLLLLVFAGAEWLTGTFAQGFGMYFLPDAALAVMGWRGWPLLSLAALAAYLLLHRDRDFWKALGVSAGCSAGVFLAGYLLSLALGGRLSAHVATLVSEAVSGYWDSLVYDVSLWLVLLCALLSAWEFLRSILRLKMQNRSLELRDQLLFENYRSLEERVREEAAQRHEAAHNLTALDAMVQARDWQGLEGFLERWKEEASAASPPLTGNYAIDAILQDAAKKAKRLGAAFTVEALVPKELPLPYQDLCSLLMNLLDNALEACAQVEDAQRRSLHLRVALQQGFLAVKCENSYNGVLRLDEQGRPCTTKAHPETHGFGIPKMSSIAEKYHSILDVRFTNDTFLVQTALKLPSAS